MGKQKGKKVYAGRSGGGGMLPQKAIAAKAPRVYVTKPGEKVPAPDGLPAGWFAERIKDFKGKALLRFSSEDGKWKQLASVAKVIRKDAETKGYDAEAAVKAFEKKTEEKMKKHDKAKADAAAPEKSALEAFRAKHGPLDHNTIKHLPGWSLESRVIPKTGQQTWLFKGPGETQFLKITQVEAFLGKQVQAGKKIEKLDEARKAAEESPKMKIKSRRKNPRSTAKLAKVKPGGDKMDVDKNKPKTKFSKTKFSKKAAKRAKKRSQK